MALESGRYMETVGWMSANLTEAKGNSNDIAFDRRYLDQNRVTYEYHTGIGNFTFDTLGGRFITSGLHELEKKYDLDYRLRITSSLGRPTRRTTHFYPYSLPKLLPSLWPLTIVAHPSRTS